MASAASSRRNSLAGGQGGAGSRRGSVDSDGGFPFPARLKKEHFIPILSVQSNNLNFVIITIAIAIETSMNCCSGQTSLSSQTCLHGEVNGKPENVLVFIFVFYSIAGASGANERGYQYL